MFSGFKITGLSDGEEEEDEEVVSDDNLFEKLLERAGNVEKEAEEERKEEKEEEDESESDISDAEQFENFLSSFEKQKRHPLLLPPPVSPIRPTVQKTKKGSKRTSLSAASSSSTTRKRKKEEKEKPPKERKKRKQPIKKVDFDGSVFPNQYFERGETGNPATGIVAIPTDVLQRIDHYYKLPLQGTTPETLAMGSIVNRYVVMIGDIVIGADEIALALNKAFKILIDSDLKTMRGLNPSIGSIKMTIDKNLHVSECNDPVYIKNMGEVSLDFVSVGLGLSETTVLANRLDELNLHMKFGKRDALALWYFFSSEMYDNEKATKNITKDFRHSKKIDIPITRPLKNSPTKAYTGTFFTGSGVDTTRIPDSKASIAFLPAFSAMKIRSDDNAKEISLDEVNSINSQFEELGEFRWKSVTGSQTTTAISAAPYTMLHSAFSIVFRKISSYQRSGLSYSHASIYDVMMVNFKNAFSLFDSPDVGIKEKPIAVNIPFRVVYPSEYPGNKTAPSSAMIVQDGLAEIEMMWRIYSLSRINLPLRVKGIILSLLTIPTINLVDQRDVMIVSWIKENVFDGSSERWEAQNNEWRTELGAKILKMERLPFSFKSGEDFHQSFWFFFVKYSETALQLSKAIEEDGTRSLIEGESIRTNPVRYNFLNSAYDLFYQIACSTDQTDLLLSFLEKKYGTDDRYYALPSVSRFCYKLVSDILDENPFTQNNFPHFEYNTVFEEETERTPPFTAEEFFAPIDTYLTYPKSLIQQLSKTSSIYVKLENISPDASVSFVSYKVPCATYMDYELHSKNARMTEYASNPRSFEPFLKDPMHTASFISYKEGWKIVSTKNIESGTTITPIFGRMSLFPVSSRSIQLDTESVIPIDKYVWINHAASVVLDDDIDDIMNNLNEYALCRKLVDVFELSKFPSGLFHSLKAIKKFLFESGMKTMSKFIEVFSGSVENVTKRFTQNFKTRKEQELIQKILSYHMNVLPSGEKVSKKYLENIFNVFNEKIQEISIRIRSFELFVLLDAKCFGNMARYVRYTDDRNLANATITAKYASREKDSFTKIPFARPEETNVDYQFFPLISIESTKPIEKGEEIIVYVPRSAMNTSLFYVSYGYVDSSSLKSKSLPAPVRRLILKNRKAVYSRADDVMPESNHYLEALEIITTNYPKTIQDFVETRWIREETKEKIVAASSSDAARLEDNPIPAQDDDNDSLILEDFDDSDELIFNNSK